MYVACIHCKTRLLEQIHFFTLQLLAAAPRPLLQHTLEVPPCFNNPTCQLKPPKTPAMAECQPPIFSFHIVCLSQSRHTLFACVIVIGKTVS